jgi:hypothetical protein
MTLKKILILAYDFPPKQSVGAERPFGWFKYLPKYGFDPTVITIKQEELTPEQKRNLDPKDSVIWTESHKTFRDRFIIKYGNRYALVRRFLSLLIFLFEFVSFRFDSKKSIYFEARSILQKQKFDVIIATGEPFIMFKYASLLSKEFNVPWIADYRDDWVYDHSLVNKPFLYRFIIDSKNKYFEKVYLANSSCILTVNKDIQNKIQGRIMNKPVNVLNNGFDIELIQSSLNLSQKEFIISYAGTLYDFDYLKPFTQAFNKFMAKFDYPDNVKIKFYGLPNKKNRASIDVLNLKTEYPNHIEIYPFMELTALIPELQKSSVFLNLIAADPSKGYLGTKIFMYACLERPIISIPSINDNSNLFFSNRNVHFVSYDADELNELLCQFYNDFKTQGYLKTDISFDEKFSISRENNAKNLSKIIKLFLYESS